jgi:NAD(P)-dependent dehydrogenase (short-subunit alcohol dehydrogenase family)
VTGSPETDTPTALITGCSSGIGRACAIEFARRGYRVTATARRAEPLLTLAVASRLVLDVTDDQSVRAAVAAAGEIDVLVNNAGISAWGPAESLGPDLLEMVLATNLLGTARVIAAVLPGMRARRRGRIINVSSAALRGFPLLGAYSASKAALEAWTETLRLEVAELGVTVCLVEPGAVESSFGRNRVDVVSGQQDYEGLERQAREMLTGMRGEKLSAEEVAAAIADLAGAADLPLRNAVGPAAQRLLDERVSVDDATYEASVQSALGRSAEAPSAARP